MTTKDDEYWQNTLDSHTYRITRKGGTESPFSGKYDDFYENGLYSCACCNAQLFDSKTKYKSGSGWPSFYAPINDDVIQERTDTGHGMVRTEIRCAACSAHLGHVFPDGPPPTGLRYCVNSASLIFVETP